ncbi:uncharacterized protein SPPG_01997 [Spizellomyces punctatus DAOM BR117]|uniref:Cyclic nucleotide-binding domain-containing protein n=1 Tax=Spizellomyces punctatus (strain DAOM BR117) TaxID=645134 RepID=A0A0L0HNB6_SPIPD|nr:uncharacterized protein SPPG_01997 [Spizellomyces punctatus DAOM BR117]KND02916.1 hypothetical protein SPPG_01997 [Spizellomyces punctatus DAOM BR117]|eukprot:XP_016610955.1 hypothetical protein SPPG_01997 [Spizellomyces punctatus DAOM BR117]
MTDPGEIHSKRQGHSRSSSSSSGSSSNSSASARGGTPASLPIPTPTIPTPTQAEHPITARLRRTGSGRGRTQIARSYYSTRSDESCYSIDEPSLTLSAAQVRQQTLSWTYRELKLGSTPLEAARRRSTRPPFPNVLREGPSAPEDSTSDATGGAGQASSADPRAGKDMFDSLLQQKTEGFARKRQVSQLSALRQLALSIEQQTAADDAEDNVETSTEQTPLLAAKSARPVEDTEMPDVSRPFRAAIQVEEGFAKPNGVRGTFGNDDVWEDRASAEVMDEAYSSGRKSYGGQCWDNCFHEMVRSLKQFEMRDLLTWSGWIMAALPAVVLALILNLLDAMSYGIIIFPSSDEHMPDTAIQAGISMFLTSTLISQLVYTLGGSAFKGAVGSMMIEVMPFLHIMCRTVEEHMNGADSKAILATIMVAYAMSTLMTGIVFFLLGAFKLGNLIQFFPRHILVGCIGGIGLFLILTGIEVTTGIPNEYSLEWIRNIFTPSALMLWGSSLGLAVCLKIMQRRIHHPLFVPMFYVAVPVVFFIIVLVARIPMDELRRSGWLFPMPEGEPAPFYEFWTYYDFGKVDWTALPATIPTQLALTFFGILHVPINVPALAVSTHQDVDLNRELIGHGISNFVSGLFGATQNYLVYSNSILYIRSGGASITGGLLLALGTALVWIAGGKVVAFVPTIVVGALIFHLGIDLLKESVVDTWNTGIHTLEYLTILSIVTIMGVVGFTEGIVAGVILACTFFVVMYARKSVIRAVYTGSQLRSTVHRLYRQQCFLDQVGDQIHCIKLQGFMFFGTINQLDVYMQNVLNENPRIRYIVLDFSLIYGIDYSALESFHRIKRMLRERNTGLVFAGLATVGRTLAQSGIFEHEEEQDALNVHNFGNLNEALEWCENQLLVTYYVKQASRSSSAASLEIPRHTVPPALNDSGSVFGISHLTPRQQEVHKAASKILKEDPLPPRPEREGFLPVAILLQAFSENAEYDAELLHFCEGRFQRVTVAKGTILWFPGEEAKDLYVIEEGELALLIVEHHRSGQQMKVVETLLPGTMVGELEMFTSRPRTCRLVANDDSVLWRLSKETFERMSEENPQLMLKFVTKIALSFDAVRFYNTVYHWGQLK